MTDHPSLKLPADRRKALFASAGAEFAANGFRAASLNRIIADVGMSKSSFYHFFTNKEDLFRQTLHDALAPMLSAHHAIDLSVLDADTFWAELERMTLEMTDLASSSVEMVNVGRMFYRSLENPDERALTAEIMEEMTGWITSLMRRGQELDLVRRDLPNSLLLEGLMALGMSVDRWMLANWTEISDAMRVELNRKTLDLFIRILKP
jgi:AcrR family transcriptional regulator